MKLIIFALSICTYTFSQAQNNRNETLQAINRDVWTDFIKGVNSGVDDLYINVHSTSFYWTAPGSKGRIMDFEEYANDSRSVMQKRKEKGEKSELSIRFLSRNIKEDFAVETCIMKFTLVTTDGPQQPGYGIVHFFHKLENGKWKMWLQYGSTERPTEESFLQAKALEDTVAFQ